MKLDLLVVAGGRSAERDVSCISAAAILRNADPRRYRLSLAHIDSRGRWLLVDDPAGFARHPNPGAFPFRGKPLSIELGSERWLKAAGKGLRVDAVFPALHGPMGEDGTVQGLLELAGAPYVGSGVLGSAAGMDKALTKTLAKLAGLPILPYAVIEKETQAADMSRAAGLKYPVFVKPSRLGSSVGVYKVKTPRALPSAVSKAFRYDTTVIIEQGVSPRELECALLGTPAKVEASIVGEIRPNAEFYSYEAKYLDPDGAKLLIPAEVSAETSAELRALAVRAFRALGCYGLARADFLMEKGTGKLWFNEVNTLPGFTSGSLYPKLWEASGLSYPRLIDRLVDLALNRAKSRSRLSLSPLG